MNMLSSNVLCMKKRKKKSYCVSNVSDYGGKYRDKRGHSGVTMLHITEDTPPDMLAGAMDLTVHLPNGRQVKMSVERSTPMMDVLVQITTAHHLQLSSHSIQALGIAPSSQHNDKVLPYKPNTPIGTLDTQHIRVVPKGRSLPVPKNVPPGHQPFVSTFRLRVHLPRNQLYVSRVSMNARLEDIMKEVCDEKNLDQSKYEFRHPGNLDQVLDLKLTLNDYQITEIHLFSKGNSRLSQAFSASDIMALRKDEERKQTKSGGVFNLIFKRSKTSNGSGSLSSDNRSISPTHSDDSRSVTPPGVQQVNNSEKPKVPQRKRRPAPKPPTKEEARNSLNQVRKTESGLTICHSRNSSDSSGYHEASILSDNANTSLPRRPQTLLMSREADKLNGVHSKSTSNLSSMSSKSKSTSSLAFAGRKKKAPPPPPVLNAACSVDNLEASPVVESPVEQSDLASTQCTSNSDIPTPVPRQRTCPKPKPRILLNRNSIGSNSSFSVLEEFTPDAMSTVSGQSEIIEKESENQCILQEPEISPSDANETIDLEIKSDSIEKTDVEETCSNSEEVKNDIHCEGDSNYSKHCEKSQVNYARALENIHVDLFSGSFKKKAIPLETQEEKDGNTECEETMLPGRTDTGHADELLGDHEHAVLSNGVRKPFKKQQSVSSLRSVDSIPGCMGSSNMKKWNNIQDLDDISMSSGEFRGNWVVGDSDAESLPPAQENNLQTQVYSTNSPPESIASSLATTLSSNIETDLIPSKENSEIVENEKPVIERMKEIQPILEPIKIETPKEGDINDLETEWQYQLPSPPTAFRDSSPVTENLTNYESTEPDHFKPDSVITSPELFEKLKVVKEAKSEISENQSEDDKPILNKLSLENLEKRKSLVYNRELATSLKYKDDESAVKSQKTDSISSKRSSVISELEEVINHPKPNNLTRSNSKADNYIQIESSLPNFKITTYDMPKKKINIFEDDSIRSNSETNNNIVKTPDDTNLYKKSEDVFKKPQEINKYRSKTMARSKTTDNCLTRSESFSMSNWVPANPVKRSKSQVGISEYIEEEKKMSKSNSLFDVSGLQSLEVIRNIQMKLKQEKEIKNNIEKAKDVQEKAKTVSQSQPYASRGPPSINLGTWSERPKSQISLKEDTDYKFNTANLKPNETSIKPVEIKRSTFKQTDFNGVNVRVNASDEKTNVSIKVNGSETISSQPSGNVVIKIGGSEQSNNEDFSKRFINHTTAVGYRKPLGNINKVSTRPHSIAHDDVSRLPIVRSVELKKPFKDTQVNTSITQINGESKQQSFTNTQVYVTSEPIRLNSFNQAPVVKGFKQSESNKNMWNSYKTLPMKPTPKMDTPTTNQNVSFSQRNLRRTESIKNTPTSNNNNINNNNTNSNVFDHVVLRNTQNSFNNNNKRFSTGMMSNINLNNNIKNVEKPPPPPIMPKVNGFSQNKKPEKMVVDPRDELLSAIRDFGGKKGLKAVKI